MKKVSNLTNTAMDLMVYSHWPSPEPGQPGQGQGLGLILCRNHSHWLCLMVYSHLLSPELGPESGRMGCMVLSGTFHTAPEQEQGPEQGHERMCYVHIFQVVKLFRVVCFNDISVAFRCPVLVISQPV